MSFPCPKCHNPRSRAYDTRALESTAYHGMAIRRRRECMKKSCKHRWSTLEEVAVLTRGPKPKIQTSAFADVEAKVNRFVANKLNQLAYKLRKGQPL